MTDRLNNDDFNLTILFLWYYSKSYTNRLLNNQLETDRCLITNPNIPNWITCAPYSSWNFLNLIPATHSQTRTSARPTCLINSQLLSLTDYYVDRTLLLVCADLEDRNASGTEVRQCLNYTLHSELSFTRLHRKLFYSTTYDSNYGARSLPLARHNNMCSLPQLCTTHTHTHVEIITRIFHSLKQSSLEEDFNATDRVVEVERIEVGVYSCNIKPCFISNSIISACFNCRIHYIRTWALDIK